MRFDFHPTSAGWRVSEINSDVPGGWREGTSLPKLFQPLFPALETAGSPLLAWSDLVCNSVGRGPVVFLSAPGFLEDQHVVWTLLRELNRKGIVGVSLQDPGTLRRTGHDRCMLQSAPLPVSRIVLFFQIEWFCRLATRTRWKRFFLSPQVMITNPLVSAVSESKRFPLLFNREFPCPTLRQYLPESRDCREITPAAWDGWVLKGNYSNTGESVYLVSEIPRQQRRDLSRRALRNPLRWVLQQRFHTLPLDSSLGRLFPCIGVFVVNGRAVGAYGRLSPNPVVDGSAIEAAVLIDPAEARG